MDLIPDVLRNGQESGASAVRECLAAVQAVASRKALYATPRRVRTVSDDVGCGKPPVAALAARHVRSRRPKRRHAAVAGPDPPPDSRQADELPAWQADEDPTKKG